MFLCTLYIYVYFIHIYIYNIHTYILHTHIQYIFIYTYIHQTMYMHTYFTSKYLYMHIFVHICTYGWLNHQPLAVFPYPKKTVETRGKFRCGTATSRNEVGHTPPSQRTAGSNLRISPAAKGETSTQFSPIFEFKMLVFWGVPKKGRKKSWIFFWILMQNGYHLYEPTAFFCCIYIWVLLPSCMNIYIYNYIYYNMALIL